MASREAIHTIKGFMYQFHKTLLSILSAASSYDRVVVEGYMEDIDIFTRSNKQAIQCKYYESKNKLNASWISTPILQMISSAITNPDWNFELFLYYKDCNRGNIDFTSSMLDDILNTKDKENIVRFFPLIYEISDAQIQLLADKQPKTKDEKEKLYLYFISNDKMLKERFSKKDILGRVTLTGGLSYSEMQKSVIDLLTGIYGKENAENLFYPNAFSFISDMSIRSDINERTITKADLLAFLEQRGTILFTKWTRLIIAEEKILKTKIRELSPSLQQNTRKRCLILDATSILNFEHEVSTFISDYLKIYYSKPKLQLKPFFSIICNEELIYKIEMMLYKRKISFINGRIGNEIILENLFDENSNFGAQIQICRYDETIGIYLSQAKLDDIYVFGNFDISIFTKSSLNAELFPYDNFHQIRQLLKIRGV